MSNSGYVVFDTSLLTDLSRIIKSSIGSTANVGIIILAVVTGVSLITFIVKKFTGGVK